MKKIRQHEVIKFKNEHKERQIDSLIIEEPLEIKVILDGVMHQLSITMRTPGEDFDLVKGFLFTEGIIHTDQDIAKIAFDAGSNDADLQSQSVSVFLHKHVDFDPATLQRHFYSSSSCGVCGKSSIDMVKQEGMYFLKKDQPIVSAELLYTLSIALFDGQSLFGTTGGNHAAALFDQSGELSLLSEDVGRHNAVDKLIGKAMTKGLLPVHEHGLLVSGRAGFELVQKAWMAGIGLFVAIGAPSTLAVELADEVGMTLVGFLGGERFNVYGHEGRIK